MSNWIYDNLMTVITLAITISGGIFALFQWHQSTKIKRTEFILQIITKLRYDENFADTSYLIEYGEFKYTPEFHGDHTLERKIAALLAECNYICYIYKLKIISKAEFNIFKNEITWILKNFDIQCYIWNIYHFSMSNKAPCSFEYLIDFGITGKILSDDFCLAESKTFEGRKYMNF
ncbi:MAG: hypothetical protein FWD71_12125 [Oscillospiraceae bacterium]|nr:hypothetical protein [Oscillospiraceae bacterium]